MSTTAVVAIAVTCFLWTSCVTGQAVPSTTEAPTVTPTNSSADPSQTTNSSADPSQPTNSSAEPSQSPTPSSPQSLSAPEPQTPLTTVSRELSLKFGLPIVRLRTTDAAPADEMTTATGGNKKTGVAAKDDFAVDMIRPFVKSTISYSYTELRGPADTPESTRTAPSSQAYSLSVTPYDCGGGGGGGVSCGRRKRKRKPSTGRPDADEMPTNTILPLAKYPAADGGDGSSQSRRPVFQVAADQLELLYTVQRQSTEAADTTAAVQQVTGGDKPRSVM